MSKRLESARVRLNNAQEVLDSFIARRGDWITKIGQTAYELRITQYQHSLTAHTRGYESALIEHNSMTRRNSNAVTFKQSKYG